MNNDELKTIDLDITETQEPETETKDDGSADGEVIIEHIDIPVEDKKKVEREQSFNKQERTDRPYWYVVYTYSGYENKVMDNLLKTVDNHGLHDVIYDVKVPMEETIEVKNGKRKHVQRKLFPGYVMVKMYLTDESPDGSGEYSDKAGYRGRRKHHNYERTFRKLHRSGGGHQLREAEAARKRFYVWQRYQRRA